MCEKMYDKTDRKVLKWFGPVERVSEECTSVRWMVTGKETGLVRASNLTWMEKRALQDH